MERMSGIDATFLYLDTPEQPMVINGILVVDVSGMDGGYSYEHLLAELKWRIKEIPPFRRKIYDSPLNAWHPAWVEEYELDVEAHVRKVVLPPGSDHQRLLDVCGEFASRPLNRSRPLWEAWVIEGLPEPDHIAFFCRIHHAVLDGMSGAELLGKLATTKAAQPERSAELVRTEAGAKNTLQLIAGGLTAAVRAPLTFLRLLPETIAMPLTMARKSGGASSSDAMPAPFTAPRTMFNATLTPHRALGTLSLDLKHLKEIKNAAGTTINDVLLTIVGGGLREYLHENGGAPEKPLMTTMPVSTHGESDSTSANQVSAMFATLATDIVDPVQRLKAIASRTARGKKQYGSVRPNLLEDWATLAPSVLVNAAVKFYGTMRLAEVHPAVHNLVISNVPGPRGSLYFLGARIVNLYPFGPLFHGSGLSVTVVSFDGKLDFGIISCEHLVPDPQAISEHMQEVADELYNRLVVD